MRREVRVCYRTRTHPRPFVHWSHDNIDELAPGELLRVVAELGADEEVALAWVDYRDVTEWTRSLGRELLHLSNKGVDMTVAPYLSPDLFQLYRALEKGKKLDVLQSDPSGPGEARHAIAIDGGPTRVVLTSELEQIIRDLATDHEEGEVE